MYATLSKFEQEIQQSDVQKVLVFKPLKTQHCKMSLTTIIQQSAMMPTGYLIAKSKSNSSLVIFWILHVHEIGPFMPNSSVLF